MLNLKANDILENQPFIVRQISKKISQNNKEYYSLHISYGIRNYDAKIWSGDVKIAQEIISGCVANVSGVVREFKGNLQIHINKIERIINPDKRLLEQITPSCEVKEIDLIEEVKKIILSVKNPYLSELLNTIFSIDNIRNSFYRGAAGAEIHHAYVGGLAQHSIEVAKVVMQFCNIYPSIDYDIAVTAALLHDIGKTVELSNFPENKYTDRGRLLGHIYIGVEILNENISGIKDFPADLRLSLEHCILSHHGTLEMGSPVLPMTLEAIALHNADKSSAEINGFYLAIQRDSGTDSWTDYNGVYKRFIKK